MILIRPVDYAGIISKKLKGTDPLGMQNTY